MRRASLCNGAKPKAHARCRRRHDFKLARPIETLFISPGLGLPGTTTSSIRSNVLECPRLAAIARVSNSGATESSA